MLMHKPVRIHPKIIYQNIEHLRKKGETDVHTLRSCSVSLSNPYTHLHSITHAIKFPNALSRSDSGVYSVSELSSIGS